MIKETFLDGWFKGLYCFPPVPPRDVRLPGCIVWLKRSCPGGEMRLQDCTRFISRVAHGCET